MIRGLFALELAQTRLCLGDRLVGKVVLTSRDDPRLASLREVNVLVRAHVHSASSDEKVVAFHDDLSARGVVASEYPFACTLIEGPVSWAGALVTVDWEVRLRVSFHQGDDLVERALFVLSPRVVPLLDA